MPTLYTRVAGVPARPAILALDFDGVLCDGMREYFEASWRAWRRIHPSTAATPPPGLFESFARVRPVVESGWEMPLVIMALLAGASDTALLERWQPAPLLAELGRSREEVAAAVDRVRDEWIADDESGWLDHHRFYPGVVEKIRPLVGGPTRPVVVTTKEGRFARRILARHGLELGDGDIYGKEAGGPKPTILRELAGATPEALWFVEDRLEALAAVTRVAELDGVELFLAAWGYNTPRDRDAARRDDRVALLTLAQFVGDFSGWRPDAGVADKADTAPRG
jgi:phosphoglycolate phosphatase-like HAD superfamily hydrolase